MLKDIIQITDLNDIQYQGIENHYTAHVKIKIVFKYMLCINLIYFIKMGFEVYYLTIEHNDLETFLALIFVSDTITLIVGFIKFLYLYFGDYRICLNYIIQKHFNHLEFNDQDYQSTIQLMHAVQVKKTAIKVICGLEEVFHFIVIAFTMVSFIIYASSYTNTVEILYFVLLLFGIIRIMIQLLSLALLKKKQAKENGIRRFKLCSDDTHDQECIICLQKYNKSQLIVGLPCSSKHYFHHDCILKWVTAKGDCPMCKTKIKVDEHHAYSLH